jgi:hypothetical protein
MVYRIGQRERVYYRDLALKSVAEHNSRSEEEVITFSNNQSYYHTES